MSAQIAVQDLKFSFAGATRELIHIKDLKISAGEKIFLHGPSGCGKSTFLELLSGVLSFQSGKIEINQKSLEKMSNAEKDFFRAQHMGYIFQNFNLLPYLNIYENITLPLFLSKKKISNMQSEVQKLCQRLKIDHLLNQNVSQLSVGQQQRVAVARALIGRPDLILADEPTSALDFDHRDQFLKLLFEICTEQKITLVFVSHDHSFKNLFDRAIAFNEINQVSL